MSTAHLAIDLGASSGRAIIGILGGKPAKLRLEEVHRFVHQSCPTPAGPVWDLTGIWLNILTGLRNANAKCREQGLQLASVGVDTWGVDWSLVGKSGELLTQPHCYRDPQNENACARVVKQLGGKEKLYERTGIQLMAINSLFQVAARYRQEPELFDAAHRLLFMPDLFHYWLSGEMTTERTIASTSGMLELESGDWDKDLMRELGIPTHVLGPIIEPGTKIGMLRMELEEATGVTNQIQVIAPASHDTASAVAAIPAADSKKSWAFLSSGTWSLLGAELAKPFASPQSCAAPFTNERGLKGSVRFLKNIAGLWLVQELRRELESKGDTISFAELTDEARNADAFRTLIDPNDVRFAAPGDMAKKIREFASETDQPEPETTGDLVRCCLESLALCYRYTINQLESVLSTKFDVVHIVGGGVNNQLLNELSTLALDRPVICGPVEATAIGNLLVQALGCGKISTVNELRKIVGRSFELQLLDADRESELEVIPPEIFELYRQLVGRGKAKK